MEIKWGIAAAGRITHDFVTSLATIFNNYHKIVAIADPDFNRAKDFAFKHGIKKFYSSFEELAIDPNVDIIYVGTINPFHYKVTNLMLENGKNVLCEKPLCLSYSDAKKLYDLAKKRNVFLMEAMWSRCFPSYFYLNQLINHGEIGDVQEIVVTHGFQALGVDRITTRQLGGGITMDIGIYAIQLSQMLFKQFPKKIFATGTLNEKGVDIESEIVIEYGNNKKLFAKVSALKDLENMAVVKGTKGEIIMENYWCCTKIIKPDDLAEEWPLPLGKYEFNHTNGCGLRYEAEEVRKCLENGLKECPLYTQANSLEMIKIEDEIRKQLGVDYNDVLK